MEVDDAHEASPSSFPGENTQPAWKRDALEASIKRSTLPSKAKRTKVARYLFYMPEVAKKVGLNLLIAASTVLDARCIRPRNGKVAIRKSGEFQPQNLFRTNLSRTRCLNRLCIFEGNIQ